MLPDRQTGLPLTGSPQNPQRPLPLYAAEMWRAIMFSVPEGPGDGALTHDNMILRPQQNLYALTAIFHFPFPIPHSPFPMRLCDTTRRTGRST